MILKKKHSYRILERFQERISSKIITIRNYQKFPKYDFKKETFKCGKNLQK